MTQPTSHATPVDEKLFSNLLGEVYSFQEILQVLERGPVSLHDVVEMIGGIQRDIIQIYRSAHA